MNFITILEYVGIVAFAVSGAYVAIGERLDLFGVYIISFISAVGGGVCRDLITDVGIPLFFTDNVIFVLVMVVTTISILIKKRFIHPNLFLISDTLGLSIFVVSAGLKAIDNNYSFVLYLFVCAITGVGGGIIRDIIINVKPSVFRKEVYASAGLAGALVLRVLCIFIPNVVAAYIAMVVIATIRIVCYLKKINLPIPERKISR